MICLANFIASPACLHWIKNWRSTVLGGLLGCLLVLGLWSGTAPAGLAAPIDPQLKAQILQVIRENPEVILETVRTYQQKLAKQRQQARQNFLQRFKTAPQQVIGQSPTLGATNGKLLLVEFSDFQCPYCASARTIIQQFMAQQGATVTLVFKNFPLTSIHPEALPAAQAAWAAGRQGQFWAYHDALFEQQKQLGEPLYQTIAQKLKLDMPRFERDRTAAVSAIQADLDLAESLGLEGTPFVILNGEVLNGLEDISTLEAALSRAKSAPNR